MPVAGIIQASIQDAIEGVFGAAKLLYALALRLNRVFKPIGQC